MKFFTATAAALLALAGPAQAYQATQYDLMVAQHCAAKTAAITEAKAKALDLSMQIMQANVAFQDTHLLEAQLEAHKRLADSAANRADINFTYELRAAYGPNARWTCR
jgi:hypothetical protein